MKFSIVKESLLTALSDFNDIISRKTTTPIISHIYIHATNGQLQLRATDTEVSLEGVIEAEVRDEGATTVPGAKLLDVVRNLPANAHVVCELKDEHFHINAQDSHFRLSTLPAEDFPVAEEIEFTHSVALNSDTLNELMQKVKFSIAVQDVRYYFNGLYLDLIHQGKNINAVSTDGHRLSCASAELQTATTQELGILIPRKGVDELGKLLARVDQSITLNLGERQLQLAIENYRLTTKLIDGQFPNYESVMPSAQPNPIIINRQGFLHALQRAKVLLVDRHDGVKLNFNGHKLFIAARNHDNESVDEVMEIINPENMKLEISLNINYLIDVIKIIEGETIQLHFQDSESPCLITSQSDESVRYVIMPMRL